MTATIDEALALLEDTGPEYGGGLANHGPMAAEALFALGRGDAAVPWAERYKRRLSEHPQARKPIAAEDWREALGEGDRVGDWIAFFGRELADASWQAVLNRWAPRLGPGIVAAATHGVIRTGHAVRSLAAEDTPERRHELAEGLAYWAARYTTLPGAPQPGADGVLPSQAIRDVAFLPDERRAAGLITVGLSRLDDEFAGAINLVDASTDVSAFVSDMTETFAHAYLANANDGFRVIVFIHSVTGPSAARILAPHLEPDAVQPLLSYAWQAGAALYSAFGSAPAPSAIEAPAGDRDDLIDRAVATGDEHAIKFTEACLREYELNPKPVYLAAARHAAERLGAK